MPAFDGEPDADWTDEYAWTRYRGPDPYPVPGDWVLNLVEGDGVIWYRYPAHGEGFEKDDHVLEAFKEDPDTEDPYDAYNEVREESADLGHEIVEDDPVARETTLKQQLRIEGTTVFERVDPHQDDLWEATADALSQYDDGTPVDEIEVSFATGSKPADQLREETIEQRKQENVSLADFAADGGGIDEKPSGRKDDAEISERCTALTAAGDRCQNAVSLMGGGPFCGPHSRADDVEVIGDAE